MSNDSDDEPPPRVLGLVADEGLPTRLAHRIEGAVATGLAESIPHDGGWRVETISRPVTLGPQWRVRMMAIGRQEKQRRGWQVVVLITDLPRRVGARPILAACNMQESVNMISVPALGPMGLRRRAGALVENLAVQQCAGAADDFREDPPRARMPTSGPRTIAGRVGVVTSAQSDVDWHLTLQGTRGQLRVILGMVRGNRPWVLVPSLSPALAAASAGAAFGVFYNSIWQLSDRLTTLRLGLITLLAVSVMTAWLLLDNNLLDRRNGEQTGAKRLIFNSVTITTVATAVVLMYVVLYLGALAAALIVIPDSLFQSQLDHPVSFFDYAAEAWLTASLGTVAGAVGSGLADEEVVRRAAYGHRERQRLTQEESDDSSR